MQITFVLPQQWQQQDLLTGGFGTGHPLLQDPGPRYAMLCYCPQLMIFCVLSVSYHWPTSCLSLSSANKIGTRCPGAEP